jgi:uncharacterized protein
MKLQNEFTVAAAVDRTWDTLLDVERVAACLPGASIEPVGEDGTYRGNMKLKVGPVTMAYSGTVRLADVDVDERVASFDARAKETKGTGTAAAVIRNRLQPQDGGTKVLVETELNVTGRPAQFGRGMMEDVASKMLGDFAGRLEQLIVTTPEGLNGSRRDDEPAPDVAPASTAPADAGEAPAFDVGSLLLRGYGRQVGVAGMLAFVAALILRRPRRGVTVTIKFRL